MGLWGRLFGSETEVKGRITVINLPPATNYILTTCFLPTTARAPPPMHGLPPEEEWGQLKAGNLVSSKLPTIGDQFELTLAPGHYQVLIVALPFVIEGQQMVTDPASRAGFWPLPSAFEVVAGVAKHLPLRLTFPKGLGQFGDPVGPSPLMSRIGAVNVERFGAAAALGNTEQPEKALRAYEAMLASQQLQSLPRFDATELRLVVELGRVKCLLALGRDHEARDLMTAVGKTLLPTLRLSLADPMTAYELAATSAALLCAVGPRGQVGEAVGDAISTLKPFFEGGGPNATQAGSLSFDLFIACMHRLRASGDREAVLALASIAFDAAQQFGVIRLTLLSFVHRIDALASVNRVDAALELVSAAKQQFSSEVIAEMGKTASLQQLSHAQALLSGQRRA